MSNRGMLIILSGPSGSGKGTIIKRLLQERADTVLSISATTRAPRPGELDNVHYYFKTREAFEELISRSALLEYAEYSGDRSLLEENFRLLSDIVGVFVQRREENGLIASFEGFVMLAGTFISMIGIFDLFSIFLINRSLHDLQVL